LSGAALLAPNVFGSGAVHLCIRNANFNNLQEAQSKTSALPRLRAETPHFGVQARSHPARTRSGLAKLEEDI